MGLDATLCQLVPQIIVARTTDLCDRRDTLWDFFKSERAALHSEAVAATAVWASQRRRESNGQGDQNESGEAQQDHGGFLEDPEEINQDVNH